MYSDLENAHNISPRWYYNCIVDNSSKLGWLVCPWQILLAFHVYFGKESAQDKHCPLGQEHRKVHIKDTNQGKHLSLFSCLRVSLSLSPSLPLSLSPSLPLSLSPSLPLSLSPSAHTHSHSHKQPYDRNLCHHKNHLLTSKKDKFNLAQTCNYTKFTVVNWFYQIYLVDVIFLVNDSDCHFFRIFSIWRILIRISFKVQYLETLFRSVTFVQ